MLSLMQMRFADSPETVGLHDVFSYVPSRFAEENLVVSNVIGHISSPTFLYDRETTRNNLVLYVISGKFYVEQYGQKHVLQTGDGILMSLKDAHRYYSDKTDVASFAFFHFRGKLTDDLIDLLLTHQKLPILFHQADFPSHLYQCFQVLSERNETFEYELSSAIFSTVMAIVKQPLWEIQNAERTMEQTDFSDRVMQYLEQHLTEKITLEEMAAAMNQSKFHFCRAFSAQFNLSPMQYVMNRRLHLAQQLLIRSEDGLEQIAQQLAFSDQSHFSKSFKKKYGITPSQYRKMHINSYLFDTED